MKIEISCETSFWTDIRVESTNGDPLFEGWLKIEPDWYVLFRKVDGYGEEVARFAGRRDYLAVLADAIKRIGKDVGGKL